MCFFEKISVAQKLAKKLRNKLNFGVPFLIFNCSCRCKVTLRFERIRPGSWTPRVLSKSSCVWGWIILNEIFVWTFSCYPQRLFFFFCSTSQLFVVSKCCFWFWGRWHWSTRLKCIAPNKSHGMLVGEWKSRNYKGGWRVTTRRFWYDLNNNMKSNVYYGNFISLNSDKVKDVTFTK